MLRPELQALAKAGATCLIDGRVLELKRTADGVHTDVLLKRCDVRQLDLGEPMDHHPATRTDHLWVRLPSDALLPREPGARVPADMRSALRRRGITLLQEVSLVGRCGFYVHGNGQLGIGIVEVLPVVSEQALIAAVKSAMRSFRQWPDEPTELEHLEWVIGLAVSELRGERGAVVLSVYRAEDVAKHLLMKLETCRRSHQAELRAAAGAKRAAQRAAAHATGGESVPCILAMPQAPAVPVLGQLKATDALLARHRLVGHCQAQQDVHRVKPAKR
jgi:hypothetical protein